MSLPYICRLTPQHFFDPGPPIPNYELALELTYQTRTIPGWIIQPDFQYIVQPAQAGSIQSAPALTEFPTLRFLGCAPELNSGVLILENVHITAQALSRATRARLILAKIAAPLCCPGVGLGIGIAVSEIGVDMRISSLTEAKLPERITPQTVLPSAETAAMLFWALWASGQIVMRKVDGWESLAEKPFDQSIDLAA